MMDRLAAMEAFVRVVDAGSFSGAAKQLRVGQPAVSKTIAQLEERLGVRLLLRSTHGLTPTEAGRNFYERAKRSIEEAEEAELAARGAAATLTGRLRISAPVTFARLQLVPRLPAFFAENPALEVDLVLEDRSVNSIAAGIDVALWMGPFGDSPLIAPQDRDVPKSRHRRTCIFRCHGRSPEPDRPSRASDRHLRPASGRPDLDLSSRIGRGFRNGERKASRERGRRCAGGGVCRSRRFRRWIRMDVHA